MFVARRVSVCNFVRGRRRSSPPGQFMELLSQFIYTYWILSLPHDRYEQSDRFNLYPIRGLYKAHNWWAKAHNHIPNAMCPDHLDTQNTGAHLHARTFICTITMTCAVCTYAFSLIMHQIWSIAPAICDTKEVGTSARTHVQMCSIHHLRSMYQYFISKHTPKLITIGRAIPEL